MYYRQTRTIRTDTHTRTHFPYFIRFLTHFALSPNGQTTSQIQIVCALVGTLNIRVRFEFNSNVPMTWRTKTRSRAGGLIQIPPSLFTPYSVPCHCAFRVQRTLIDERETPRYHTHLCLHSWISCDNHTREAGWKETPKPVPPTLVPGECVCVLA